MIHHDIVIAYIRPYSAFEGATTPAVFILLGYNLRVMIYNFGPSYVSYVKCREKRKTKKKKTYFGKCRTLNYFRGFLLFGHQTFGGQTIKLRDIFENGPSLLSRGKEEEFFFLATPLNDVWYIIIYIYM